MIKNLFNIIFSDFLTPYQAQKKRILFIDLLRFIAIVLMVIYHFTYDLNMFALVKVELFKGFWFVLPRIIVTLFMIASGMSFGLKNWQGTTVSERFKIFIPRLIKLFVFAAGISLVTFLAFPKNWIYFGTIHSFFTCTLLSIFFLPYKSGSLILGSMMVLNYVFKIIPLTDPLYFEGVKSMDFIPVYPWFGVFLIGFGLSKYIHLVKEITLSKPHFIQYVSQKTLPIYLLHQVLLVTLVFLISKLASF